MIKDLWELFCTCIGIAMFVGFLALIAGFAFGVFMRMVGFLT